MHRCTLRSDRTEIADACRDTAILVARSFAFPQNSTRLYRCCYSHSALLGALNMAGCDAACTRAADLRLRGSSARGCPSRLPIISLTWAMGALCATIWRSPGRRARSGNHVPFTDSRRRRPLRIQPNAPMVAGPARKSWPWRRRLYVWRTLRLRSLSPSAVWQLGATVQRIRSSTRSEAWHLPSGCFK